MMKKKLIAMSLVAAMVIGALAGCNSSKKTEESTEVAENEYKEVNLDAKEYVELGEYKNLHITGAPVEVDEEEFQARLEEDRYNYSTYEKIDRTEVQEEDIVNADVVSTVDGETIEDLSNPEIDITIGTGEMEFFDDAEIESALIGAKVGDTVKVSGTFSEMTYSDAAAGKKGQVEIKINYISKEVVPEFTDEFVKQNMDYNSVKEYEDSIREEMKADAQSYAEEENKYLLLDKVVENSKVIKDFPEDAIEAERYNSILDVRTMADYYGIEVGESDEELDQFFKESYGMSVDEYVKDALKRRCVVDLILKAENVAVTDEEINQVVKDEIEAGGYESEEEFFEGNSKEDIRGQLEQEKIFDILMATAVIE